MTKENKKLAEAIFKQHATNEAVETGDKTKAIKYEIPAIGVGPTVASGKTVKECEQQMIDYVARSLDDGTISLADDWADTNLE